MYIPVNLHTFREEFRRMGRSDNFTWVGLAELFDLLEELDYSDDPDHPGVELDVVALCLEWGDEGIEEIANNYGWEPSDVVSDAETWDDVDEEDFGEWMQHYTVCRMYQDPDTGEARFIYQCF